MAGWSREATKALLLVWGEQDIQSQLNGMTRNKVVYEKVARSMEMGYDYNWKQSRTKVKTLTQTYRQVHKVVWYIPVLVYLWFICIIRLWITIPEVEEVVACTFLTMNWTWYWAQERHPNQRCSRAGEYNSKGPVANLLVVRFRHVQLNYYLCNGCTSVHTCSLLQTCCEKFLVDYQSSPLPSPGNPPPNNACDGVQDQSPSKVSLIRT